MLLTHGPRPAVASGPMSVGVSDASCSPGSSWPMRCVVEGGCVSVAVVVAAVRCIRSETAGGTRRSPPHHRERCGGDRLAARRAVAEARPRPPPLQDQHEAPTSEWPSNGGARHPSCNACAPLDGRNHCRRRPRGRTPNYRRGGGLRGELHTSLRQSERGTNARCRALIGRAPKYAEGCPLPR